MPAHDRGEHFVIDGRCSHPVKDPQMSSSSHHFTLLRRNTAGSAAVEFALTAPVLLLMLFGAIEYGRVLWTQNSIQYAVEQAARCAAMGQTAGATLCTTASATKTFAAGHVVGYTVPTTDFTVTYQCPTPGASCTACGVANTKGVLVSASVPFTPFLSPSHLLPFETHLSITLTGQSCRPIYT
jgi:Flp pilus assembly protein TadG